MQTRFDPAAQKNASSSHLQPASQLAKKQAEQVQLSRQVPKVRAKSKGKKKSRVYGPYCSVKKQSVSRSWPSREKAAYIDRNTFHTVRISKKEAGRGSSSSHTSGVQFIVRAETFVVVLFLFFRSICLVLIYRTPVLGRRSSFRIWRRDSSIASLELVRFGSLPLLLPKATRSASLASKRGVELVRW